MARHDEAAALLKAGASPKWIAKQWGISFYHVTQYLYTALGRGSIHRSQIVFAIDHEIAAAVDLAVERHRVRNRWELKDVLRAALDVSPGQDDLEEALLYFDLRLAPLADMYESLCQLERFLHTYIRCRLEQVFGPNRWWKELPPPLRKQCAVKREEDPEPQDDLYCYTTFIDLHDIFKEHWSHLSNDLPGPLRADRKGFLAQLQKLNGIRNRIMHPVRGYTPTRADFELVSTFVQGVFAEASPGA